MSGLPDHHCPGCGVALKAVERYPWHFCQSCLATAQDGAGRALQFANESLSGGLRVCYRGTKNWVSTRGVLALIAGRPVLIGEARFGGIVAEPMRSGARLPRGMLDLRRGEGLEPDSPPGRGGKGGGRAFER